MNEREKFIAKSATEGAATHLRRVSVAFWISSSSQGEPMKHTVTDARPALGIVVMGVSGSGKSTLGRRLAAVDGIPFIEGDDFHSSAHIAKMASGTPLDDIDRWPWLDRIGAALGESARREGMAVASCSALKRSYRDRLRAAAGISLAFVYLVGARELLLARLQSRTGHYMPVTLLESQLAILEPPNEDERALILDMGESATQLLAAVTEWCHTATPSAPTSPARA